MTPCLVYDSMSNLKISCLVLRISCLVPGWLFLWNLMSCLLQWYHALIYNIKHAPLMSCQLHAMSDYIIPMSQKDSEKMSQKRLLICVFGWFSTWDMFQNFCLTVTLKPLFWCWLCMKYVQWMTGSPSIIDCVITKSRTSSCDHHGILMVNDLNFGRQFDK